jgi:hypothetical protein
MCATDYFESEPDWDFLYIYDGLDDTYPLLNQASGFRVPSPVISTGTDLYLYWKSDSAIHFNGWSAVFYNTNDTAIQCSNNGTLQSMNASLSDNFGTTMTIQSHTGEGSYLSNIFCYWQLQFDSSITYDTDPLIGHTNVTITPTFQVTLSFFDTALGDELRIYDDPRILPSMTAVPGDADWIMPLYTLNGVQTGRRLIVPSRNLIFIWMTNDDEIGRGWDAKVDFYLTPHAPSIVTCPTDTNGTVCAGNGVCAFNENADSTQLPAECVCNTGESLLCRCHESNWLMSSFISRLVWPRLFISLLWWCQATIDSSRCYQ